MKEAGGMKRWRFARARAAQPVPGRVKPFGGVKKTAGEARQARKSRDHARGPGCEKLLLPQWARRGCDAPAATLRPVHPSFPMASKSSLASAPLTFDLPLALLTKIGILRKQAGFGSTSDVVRQALREFDFGSYEAAEPERRQISVRLPPDVRRFLLKTARKKKVSVGELLRVAIEGLPTGRRKK